MQNPFRDSMIVIGTAAATAAVIGVVLPAVRPSGVQAPADAYRAPRIPGANTPDLHGIWQALNSANWNLEGHEARAAWVLQPGVPNGGPVPAAPVLALGAAGGIPGGLSVVEGGEIPYKPDALKTRKENFDSAIERDPEVKCLLPGVPRATYLPYPFEIIQGTNEIMIVYGYSNAGRTLHMRQVDDPGIDSWMGHSVGKWEGDTLVVDVTNLNGGTWFDRAGNFHSDALHVTERYTPIDAHHLMYEATIEDPNVFTRPWKIRMPLYRRVEDHAQVFEYRCVEMVEELIYGHLRKQQLVKHWDADYGRRGGTLVVDIKRNPTRQEDQ